MSAAVDFLLKLHRHKAAQLIVWEQWSEGAYQILLTRQTDQDSGNQIFRVQERFPDQLTVEHLALSAPAFASFLKSDPSELLPAILQQHALTSLIGRLSGMKKRDDIALIEAMPVRGARIYIQPPLSGFAQLSTAGMEMIIRYDDEKIADDDVYPLAWPSIIAALDQDIPILQDALNQHHKAMMSICNLDDRLLPFVEQDTLLTLSQQTRPNALPIKRPKRL